MDDKERIEDEELFVEEDFREEAEDENWKGVGELLDNGYLFYDKDKGEKALSYWEIAWEKIRGIIRNANWKPEIFEVDEATDFRYELDEWFTDLLQCYWNLKEYEKVVLLTDEVLTIFRWEYDSPYEFLQARGNALFHLGRLEESDLFFEEWKNKEPDNYMCIEAYIQYLMCRNRFDAVDAILSETLRDKECNADNDQLFLHAASFYHARGDEEKSDYYEEKHNEWFQRFLKNPLFKGMEQEIPFE